MNKPARGRMPKPIGVVSHFSQTISAHKTTRSNYYCYFVLVKVELNRVGKRGRWAAARGGGGAARQYRNSLRSYTHSLYCWESDEKLLSSRLLSEYAATSSSWLSQLLERNLLMNMLLYICTKLGMSDIISRPVPIYVIVHIGIRFSTDNITRWFKALFHLSSLGSWAHAISDIPIQNWKYAQCCLNGQSKETS